MDSESSCDKIIVDDERGSIGAYSALPLFSSSLRLPQARQHRFDPLSTLQMKPPRLS